MIFEFQRFKKASNSALAFETLWFILTERLKWVAPDFALDVRVDEQKANHLNEPEESS